jgi:hypothetical protein
MPNRIKPRRSYTANAVPVVSGNTPDIEQHEMAVNWTDGKIFTRDANNQLVSITLGGSGGGSSWVTAPDGSDSAGTAGQLAFSGGYLFVCVAPSTWLRTTLESFAAQNSLLLENGDYLTTETGDPLVTE